MYVGEGNGTPLQYSCLGNPMDGGAWWAAVHGVPKSRTWLSDITFTFQSDMTITFHCHALEKEMATHSSVLAWRIPGTAEPGGLPSMGSHRVGHNWSDTAACMYVSITCSLYVLFVTKIKCIRWFITIWSLLFLPHHLMLLMFFRWINIYTKSLQSLKQRLANFLFKDRRYVWKTLWP